MRVKSKDFNMRYIKQMVDFRSITKYNAIPYQISIPKVKILSK